MKIRAYSAGDIPQMIQIWNHVVEEGQAFPQEEMLNLESGAAFFAEQSFAGVAVDRDSIMGLYILHPNNIGRCGHIGNASYAVSEAARGKGIGRQLVQHCMKTAAQIGFKILQFNAVVATNESALHLYRSLGFQQLGTIPKGFHLKDGSYEDICPFYITLE